MQHFRTLAGSAKIYDKVMALAMEILQTPKGPVLQVRYEDMVSDIEIETRRILDFLSLPWSDSVWDFHKMAKADASVSTPSYHQIVNPIYQHSKYRWRSYKPYLQAMAQYLDKWCLDFDYEIPKRAKHIDFSGNE